VTEAKAIHLALGDAADNIPVSDTKGLHAHALGATGAIEAAICALALQRGWLPPTKVVMVNASRPPNLN